MNLSNSSFLLSEENEVNNSLELGGIAYLIKNFGTYFPYTFLTFTAAIFGVLGN